MRKNYYVLGVYGYQRCTVLHLEPYTRKEAERARRWQGLYAGSNSYHVVTPHPTLKATFVSVSTGAHFEAQASHWTPEAWFSFILRTWPAADAKNNKDE